MKEKDQHNNENYLLNNEKTYGKPETKLRKISEQELKEILEKHKKWLGSDGKESQRCDISNAILKNIYLSGVNLQKAEFSNVNLEHAELRGVNLQESVIRWSNLNKADLEKAKLQDAHLEESDLQGANLWNADLQGAHFDYSNLQDAVLWGANLKKARLKNANLKGARLDRVKGLTEAELQYANIEGATGLLGNEFSQADVTGTKLPDGIKDFKALEIVKETSQNARKVFFAMLLGCVYSWLTIATTTDVGLLTNTASSPLPIIGTEIPISWFYIAAPLVLICLYFYFHLYLIKLWEGLAGLPAIFPDGKRLDETAYPWLLNGLVRRHFRILKTGRPIIAHVQEWITIFLAWWVVPMTMIAFWIRYIPRHDWIGTIFHILLVVNSIAFSVIFYRLCYLTLQGIKSQIFKWRNFLKDTRFYFGVVIVIVGILFSLVSIGSIRGIRMGKEKNLGLDDFINIRKVIPWAFNIIGFDVFADFREKEISEKPENYWIFKTKEQVKSVKGANLKGRNLNSADIDRAFLIKADLRNASLENAVITEANLHQANLREAKLQEANLELANLQEAYLGYANLQKARMGRANLQEAYLGYANLQKAYLRYANLQEAVLGHANLQEANLERANLQEANMVGANLIEAILNETFLMSADLTKAKNLTIEQLKKVKTLYQAKLNTYLMEQVKMCCPHLLEKPKEETDSQKVTE